jgi:hypothetical protein
MQCLLAYSTTEMRVTRKAIPASAEKPVTLSDDDISSQRVTRRSLLGALGLGVGVAAAATFGAAEIAHADSDAKKKAPAKKPADKKPPAKKKKEETDSD